ncbi:chemotaxis response regulator protein-glutamate methylesterase [Parasalinivibrio latis]|uniref:protein-glutamate methylesterase/protein-glutamine glutaminase n=1 Tax=Parasalinivibrio latis TaxID=2952610 RepID=UPI0030E54B4F
MKPKKYKVIVVDDSAVYRALMTEILSSDPELDVIATAIDPYEAREKIKQLNPDVITLDIEMPKMDGIQFLRNLMRLRPMPVVMVSSLTQHGAEATLKALEIGAIDYVPKPESSKDAALLTNYRRLVVEKVKTAAQANVFAGPMNFTRQEPEKEKGRFNAHLCDVIAIGASTGGTEAIRAILKQLPEKMPPILITQHIKAVFSKSFADRLDKNSKLTVKELDVGQAPLVPGCVYVAPGDCHMVVTKRGDRLYASLHDAPPVNQHRPSVDIMFSSIAKVAGKRSLGILLTGMGQDGAAGLLEMRQSGSVTVAQDQASSVVWGMPRAAVEREAAGYVLALKDVAGFMTEYVYEKN